LHTLDGQVNHLANRSDDAKNPIFVLNLSAPSSLSGSSLLHVQHLNMMM
jgi:hypothetical protein